MNKFKNTKPTPPKSTFKAFKLKKLEIRKVLYFTKLNTNKLKNPQNNTIGILSKTIFMVLNIEWKILLIPPAVSKKQRVPTKKAGIKIIYKQIFKKTF